MGLFARMMIALVAALLAGIWMTLDVHRDAINLQEHTESVLEACEQDLPCSKSCEVIITAKVKGE